MLNPLFVEDEEPIGQIIRIRNVPFTVVGVLAPKGASASGSDQDDSIIVPFIPRVEVNMAALSRVCPTDARDAQIVRRELTPIRNVAVRLRS